MLITRQQSAAMRGIAILGIVLHNYTHWLRPMVKENEFTFSQYNADRLLALLAEPSWDIFAHLFSFFGHYGVPVFLFLSAYGLVVKYERPAYTTGEKPVAAKPQQSAWKFIASHYKKLFVMMAVGYSAFVLVDYMTPRPRHYEFGNVLCQLLMINNLNPTPDKVIWPGPFWYFGLMVQIYIVYRLVLYCGKGSISGRLSKQGSTMLAVAILVATLFAQLFFDPAGTSLNWYRYNCFGALPVFIFGLLFARNIYAKKTASWQYALFAMLAAVMCVALSTDFFMWIIAPFFVCISVFCLVKSLPQITVKALAWVGNISAAMFVCHAITRKVLIPISHRGDIYAGLVLYLVSTIILAVIFNHVINLILKR